MFGNEVQQFAIHLFKNIGPRLIKFFTDDLEGGIIFTFKLIKRMVNKQLNATNDNIWVTKLRETAKLYKINYRIK